ncbi:MAG: peroxiredoxin [Magnetococcus sp. MYC-9]
MLEVGAVVPDVSVPDQHGVVAPLLTRLGPQGGVIYFYPRDCTPGCTVEANDFQALQTDFATLGMTVIGISKDSVASHGRFCLKEGLSFTLLSDEGGELCNGFGVWQEKTNYGKTSMGIVRTTFVVGADGTVKKVYRSVKTAGHGMKVLNDLRTDAVA